MCLLSACGWLRKREVTKSRKPSTIQPRKTKLSKKLKLFSRIPKWPFSLLGSPTVCMQIYIKLDFHSTPTHHRSSLCLAFSPQTPIVARRGAPTKKRSKSSLPRPKTHELRNQATFVRLPKTPVSFDELTTMLPCGAKISGPIRFFAAILAQPHEAPSSRVSQDLSFGGKKRNKKNPNPGFSKRFASFINSYRCFLVYLVFAPAAISFRTASRRTTPHSCSSPGPKRNCRHLEDKFLLTPTPHSRVVPICAASSPSFATSSPVTLLGLLIWYLISAGLEP